MRHASLASYLPLLFAATAVLTAVIALAVRLLFRRGKKPLDL